MISHQTYRAGLNLGINLLGHVLILSTQKNAATNLGRFITPIEFEQAHYATLNREPQPA